MKKVRGLRRMLNLPGHHSTAVAVLEIEDTRGQEEKFKVQGEGDNVWQPQPEYTFAISDCSRTIHLELDWTTPEGQENTLHKIDTLIEVLRTGRKAIIAEQAAFRRRADKWEETKDATG